MTRAIANAIADYSASIAYEAFAVASVAAFVAFVLLIADLFSA